LGPEIAIALLDFDAADETVEFVGLVGTTDTKATAEFLDRFLEYLETEQESEFTRGTYQTYTTYQDLEGNQNDISHYAITDDYLLFTTTREVLESTVDMIISPGASLADDPELVEARNRVDESRFAF